MSVIIQPGSSRVQVVALAYAASITPDLSDGPMRRCVMTGDAALHPPGNPYEGARWECWFMASGGARTLIFDDAILSPSDSAFSGAKTIAEGALQIVLLKCNGASWMLASLVGGYS